ncbi:MAG: cobaltochelatase subunit CobN [Thermodesulfovibrio sp.]
MELKKTQVHKRKIAFILHNNPCASFEATVGSAAHLDSLESVVEIMKKNERGWIQG